MKRGEGGVGGKNSFSISEEFFFQFRNERSYRKHFGKMKKKIPGLSMDYFIS